MNSDDQKRFTPTHVLKCSNSELLRIANGARSTCRRIDDRRFTIGDRIVFVSADYPDEPVVHAALTGVCCYAGPLVLLGSPVAGHPAADRAVPVALLDFVPRQLDLVTPPATVEDVSGYRKVLAIAASVGDTISTAQALELIRSVARQHLTSVRGQS